MTSPSVSDNFSDTSAQFGTDGKAHTEEDGNGAGKTRNGTNWSSASNQRSNDAIGEADILVDGDMENAGVGAWIAGQAAVLTKETVDPFEGSRNLKVTRNDLDTPFAQQTILTIGKYYLFPIWSRSDVFARPEVALSNNTKQGTTTTAWQD